MNHQLLLVKVEPNDLNEVSGSVRSDKEHFGWVGIGFEIKMLTALLRAWRIDASSRPCLKAERWISTRHYCNTIYYRNTKIYSAAGLPLFERSAAQGLRARVSRVAGSRLSSM